MRSMGPMKAAKTGYIIISVILCVLGILLVFNPDYSLELIGTICAVILIAFGLIKLVGYFSRDLYRLAFQHDLAFGILLILLGIVMLVNPMSLMTFMSFILGLLVLTDGLFKIQTALDSRKFGLSDWWIILLSAAVTCVLGAVLIFRPSDSVRIISILLGLALLAEGILNLCTVITAVKIIRHQQPDVIDIDIDE